ncbi:MAG: thrombospondin type 3 repeat-containing protein, partial [Candidatus Krumholzibacteriota bacterium]|nr:thrombospondin type 3 repeat-containing protein [Candidatus Krumholzibacteriota bacterium]
MRFYSRSVLIFSIIALFAVPVSAQSSWDGPAGLLRVKEAGTIGKGKLLFTLGTSYYRRSGIILTDETDSFYHLADPAIKDPQVDYNFFLSRAYFALGLSNHLEIAASLDVRNWIMSVHDDHANGELKNTSRGGIGDTGMEAKICLPLPSDRVKLGFLASTTFPTGNKERKFTTDASDYSFNGLFTLDLTDLESFVPTKLHINAGYKFNKNEDFGYGILNTNNPNTSGYYPPAYPAVKTGGNNNFNDIFQFGTGVEFILKNARLFLEFKWDDFLNANYAAEDSVYFSSKNLYTLTPGISLVSGKGVGILLALDVNVSDDRCLVQPPDWMAYFAFSMGGFLLPQDRDKDGIEDKVDKCIDEPEDFDGFEDDDGCPDQDNDADGIRDDVDQCPDLAEDNDGFQDEDGCPDLDNDGDGIPDVEDNCPGEPEDFDGFEDSDGCPDILQDSDNDGVPDDVDKCPLKQEDLDGF